MTVTTLKPIAHCFGVIKAIELAKQVINDNKDKKVYVFGLLVHNEEVTKELTDLGIITIDTTKIDPIERLKEFKSGEIVIFTAHGHPKAYEKILNDNNVEFFDATCIKVKECFNIINEAKEVIYIGKANHPEANAALTMNDNVHFYDINSKFDYSSIRSGNPIVINQTTLSYLELEDIHRDIKKHIPGAIINDEICNATLLRQKAIKELSDDVDALIIVGSKKSSNTMKLYEVAKATHVDKEIIFVENVEELKKIENLNLFKNVVISSGTSTPLTTITKIEKYLKGEE